MQSGVVLPEAVREVIERVRKCDPTLVKIDLLNKQIGDSGFVALSNAFAESKNSVVKEINLELNKLTSASMKVVGPVIACLAKLNLGGNQLGPEGSRLLALELKVFLQCCVGWFVVLAVFVCFLPFPFLLILFSHSLFPCLIRCCLAWLFVRPINR